MKAVLPAIARGLLEPHLPAEVEPVWFTTPAEAETMIADATIAWVDMQPTHLTEQAIRAVELAAPFNLPPEYYNAWKRVSSFRFDRKLSQ